MDQPEHTVRRTAGDILVWCVGVGSGVLLLIGVFFAWSGPSDSRAADAGAPSVNGPERFDHDATSFPLRGAHRSVRCEQCHQGGRYATLPTRCAECHNGQLVYGKPSNHLRTAQECSFCHSESAWSPGTYRHDPATTAGQCSTCHNGQTATGKSPGHVPTTSQCDICHTTRNWAFSHSSSLTAGQCSNCHNGQIAMGKPQGHVPTTGQCDVCHNARNWDFSHTPATTAGQCSTCHNGQYATGKPQGHIATALQCDMCHTSAAWAPVNLSFHLPTRLIGGHTGLDCSSCHVVSTGTVIYRDGTTYGSCANCHTRDYQAGDHTHTTLAADATCSNCHEHAAYQF